LIDNKEQCAIGEGFIDWATIISEVKKTNCKIFAIEHDDPEDYKDYTSRSLNYLSTIE
jgi:sugar phosphate isomerase/epimerase